jgi:hypothetical protein
MADIQKKLIKLTITTKHGDTFTVTDTEECSVASYSLTEFKLGGIMNFTVEGSTYLVPASAVDSIKVEPADEEVEAEESADNNG